MDECQVINTFLAKILLRKLMKNLHFDKKVVYLSNLNHCADYVTF